MSGWAFSLTSLGRCVEREALRLPSKACVRYVSNIVVSRLGGTVGTTVKVACALLCVGSADLLQMGVSRTLLASAVVLHSWIIVLPSDCNSYWIASRQGILLQGCGPKHHPLPSTALCYREAIVWDILWPRIWSPCIQKRPVGSSEGSEHNASFVHYCKHGGQSLVPM